MSESVLTMTAGKPFSRNIRIPGATDIWTTLDSLEVRAQMRAGKSTQNILIANLHEFMTWAFDVDDLLIIWTMTGSETRLLYQLMLPYLKKGFFNIIISDVGVTDARALVVPLITLKAVDTTTSAEGLL